MNGIEVLSKEESDRVFDLAFNEYSDDYHFLAFDRQLAGFSPLGTYIQNHPKLIENHPDLIEKEDKFISKLIDKQEVGSFYPDAKLSLYPVTQIDGPKYYLDVANYEKHFADILELNDTVYKTKNLFVDFGHGAENFDEALVIEQLRELLSKSKLLEAVFVEDHI